MPMAICYECQWFRNLEPDGPQAGIWYNHVCVKSLLPTRINPVTGELENYTTNDLGRVVSTGNVEHQYCRDVNLEGECRKFKRAIGLGVVGR